MQTTLIALRKCSVIWLLLFLALFFCACSSGAELPTEIGNVGEAITKDPQLLPPSDTNATFAPAPSSGSNTAIDGVEVQQTTVEDVKQWLSEVTNDSYSKTVEPDSDIVTFSASLNCGGVCNIISYFDNYYMTEFRFPQQSKQIVDAARSCITAYIGRPMTESELCELSEAVDDISASSDMVHLPVLSNTASAYVLIDGSDIVIQVR